VLIFLVFQIARYLSHGGSQNGRKKKRGKSVHTRTRLHEHAHVQARDKEMSALKAQLLGKIDALQAVINEQERDLAKRDALNAQQEDTLVTQVRTTQSQT